MKRHRKLPVQAVSMVASRFRALGEPLRVRILEELREGEKCVSELVAAIGSTQPNISKHLRILQEAGVVGRRQAGNQVYCFISDESVLDLCDVVCDSIGERLARDARLVSELNRGR
jgi:ArsR family transcriptional regulator